MRRTRFFPLYPLLSLHFDTPPESMVPVDFAALPPSAPQGDGQHPNDASRSCPLTVDPFAGQAGKERRKANEFEPATVKPPKIRFLTPISCRSRFPGIKAAAFANAPALAARNLGQVVPATRTGARLAAPAVACRISQPAEKTSAGKRFYPQAPSRLEGSIFTPGPMVEEIATRCT